MCFGSELVAPIHQRSLTSANATAAYVPCWCVVCAQDSLGDHRIWQDTTVTVTVCIVALQQLGMSNEF